jgi:hypothetical protein
MKKDELLMFRSICSRLAKARFDFEKAGTQQGRTPGKPLLRASSMHTKSRSMSGRISRSVSFAGDDSSTTSSNSEGCAQLGTSKDHPTSFSSPLDTVPPTTPSVKTNDGVAGQKASLQESAPPIPLRLEKSDEAFASTFSAASELCQQRIELNDKSISCWSPVPAHKLYDDDDDDDDAPDSSKVTAVPAIIRESSPEKTKRISMRELIREQRKKQSKHDLAEIRQRRQQRLTEREGKESLFEGSCPSTSP